MKRIAATDDRPARLAAVDRLMSDGRPRSELETLCLQRQINDLQKGHERGLVWDGAEAERAVQFFSLLTHWKGKHFAGKPVTLEPWQQECIVRPLFGWKLEEDGTRRFRRSYVEIPRKNGKTTLSAGIGHYGLVPDHEDAAEVYFAAVKRDQAKIGFLDAKNLVRRATQLKKHLDIRAHSIHCPALGGIMVPLGGDADSLDGLNVHFAIIDELHKHKTRDLYDVILTGTGARSQPLVMSITTAGFDRSTICWEEHEAATNVLRGTHEEDDLHTFISTTDKGDDPFSPLTWHKANPNLGISVLLKGMQEQAAKAKNSRPFENTFRRLRLNEWTEQDVLWINMTAWGECEGPVPELRGRPCFAALDMAETRDVNALGMIFHDHDKDLYYVKRKFWIPEDSYSPRSHSDRRQLLNWAQQGLITETPGSVAEYSRIVEDIMELHKLYDMCELAYDPHGPAAAVIQMLVSAGFTFGKLVEFTQNFGNYAAPMQEFDRLIVSKKLRHDGDPVLRWMASNVSVELNSAGHMMPSKRKSANKIDGIVTLVMALGREIIAPKPRQSGMTRSYKAQY